MDGASRAFGAAGALTLAGRELRLTGKLRDYFGEVEAEILRERSDPWRELEKNAGRFKDQPDVLKAVSDATVALANRTKAVGRDEFWQWLGTWRGAAHLVWLAARHEHEGLTRDEVLDLMVAEEETRLLAIVLGGGQDDDETRAETRDEIVRDSHQEYAKSHGADQLGNSTGPLPKGGAGQDRQEASRGDESSASWPSSTDSQPTKSGT